MTTFHHLVREQSRSQAAAQRLRQLHKADIDRDDLKKKYKELCKAHVMQQEVVKKVVYKLCQSIMHAALITLICV